MVDLETMSTDIQAAVVTIAAVQCDLTTGKIGQEYYRVIDLNSCKDFDINPGTIYWWLEQSEAARKQITEPNKISIQEFADEFNKFLSSLGNPNYLRLWGNGVSFDNPIIRHIYYKLKKTFVVPFRNDRDVRTVMGFYPRNLAQDWFKNNLIKGSSHNALMDARYQIKYVSHVMKELGVTELY